MSEHSPEHGRFAPTTSGPAHPGTLLAGLLAWLDARSLGARFSLRLEDIDPDRCRPEHAQDMLAALAWLGLDWDACSLQSEHQAALRGGARPARRAGSPLPVRVQPRGRPARGRARAVDGSWRYPGTCRAARAARRRLARERRCAAPAARAGARRAARRMRARSRASTPIASWAIRCCGAAMARSRTTSPSSSTTRRRA